MIILWSKYPDITLRISEAKYIMGLIEFTYANERYVHSCNAALWYSNEAGFGMWPSRETLTYTMLRKFII